MLHFNDNQKRILDALKLDPYASNEDLAAELGVKPWKVKSEITALRDLLRPATRFAIVGLAEEAGWMPYQPNNSASKEAVIRRLVAGSFKPGPLKETCVKAEVVHVEAASMTTRMWIMHEQGERVTISDVNGLVADINRLQVALTALRMEADALRGEVLKVTA